MSISIQTTMKFIVRGKSVDFINREGSSPSIPTKRPVLLPNCFFILLLFFLFRSARKLAIFLIHYIISQKDRSRKASLVSQVLWYICTTETLWSRNPCLNHSQFTSLFSTLKVFFFEDSGNSRAWVRFCNAFLFSWIDIYPNPLVGWGWCLKKGWDSSVGRAEDWKSSCHQFKSGSWHWVSTVKFLPLSIHY